MKKRETFLPFCRHWLNEEEQQAVLDVLRSSWITTGPVTKAFEEDFARYVETPYSVAVTSCTGGLFMVYQALGIGEQDEVIVPAMTWPATANAAALLGAKVMFADVDYNSVCVTRETIEACLSDATKAVVVVHFAGLSCDLDPIIDLCKKNEIALIEDSAHAVGTRYNGKHVGGEYAFASVYSFHPIKNMTTAEGGMITCHDEDLYKKLLLYKFHGVSRDAWKAYGSKDLPLYDLEFPALKFNQTDILSAIGRVQLKKVDHFNRRRAEIARRYLDELSDLKELDLPVAQKGHSWHLFVVKVNRKAGISREEFMLKLKERNVGSGLHFLPVNSLSYYQDKNSLLTPIAEKVGRACISLPLYPLMTDDEVNYVIECVKTVFNEKRTIRY
jgi:dTDP-4-amino-4,6-dideoxygalactose transaminase